MATHDQDVKKLNGIRRNSPMVKPLTTNSPSTNGAQIGEATDQELEDFRLYGGSFTSGMKRKKPASKARKQADLSSYGAFLLDMDGVLHRHQHPIEGAKEFLQLLQERNLPYLLLTNEDRFTKEDLSDKLKETFGGTAPPPDRIYTAASSAGHFFSRLVRHGFTGSTYVIGEQGVLAAVGKAYNEMEEDGGEGVMLSGVDPLPEGASPVEYVVIGCVFSENTRLVERAAVFVRNGARLVHTCPDYYDTYPDGRFAFGMPMTTIHLFEQTLGCSSYNLGKPNPHMIRMAQNRLLKGTKLEWKDVLFVGDSIGTDIRTSIENGIDCALVLSGCTALDQLKRSPLHPNYVFQHIGQLLDAYLDDQGENPEQN